MRKSPRDTDSTKSDRNRLFRVVYLASLRESRAVTKTKFLRLRDFRRAKHSRTVSGFPNRNGAVYFNQPVESEF